MYLVPGVPLVRSVRIVYLTGNSNAFLQPSLVQPTMSLLYVCRAVVLCDTVSLLDQVCVWKVGLTVLTSSLFAKYCCWWWWFYWSFLLVAAAGAGTDDVQRCWCFYAALLLRLYHICSETYGISDTLPYILTLNTHNCSTVPGTHSLARYQKNGLYNNMMTMMISTNRYLILLMGRMRGKTLVHQECVNSTW